MAPVSEGDAKAMDDTAAWAGNVQPIREASPEQAMRALRLAQAAHVASHIRSDVGHYTRGLEYVPVYLGAIREYVTVGFVYSPPEPGDDEQPFIEEDFEINEVWLRGVDIGSLLNLEEQDKLIDGIKAGKAMNEGDL